MEFSEYQKKAKETAVYPNRGRNVVYPALGLSGEAGEVANKIKKIFRDDAGSITEEKRQEITKELGDVLWYVSQLAEEFGLSMDDIAAANIERLRSRKDRGVLHGSGDNR